MSRDLEWFYDNGCLLQKPRPGLMIRIYLASGGNPCKECNCKDICPAWPKVNQQSGNNPTVLRCAKCSSPLNMMKVQRRGGRCACGALVS